MRLPNSSRIILLINPLYLTFLTNGLGCFTALLLSLLTAYLVIRIGLNINLNSPIRRLMHNRWILIILIATNYVLAILVTSLLTNNYLTTYIVITSLTIIALSSNVRVPNRMPYLILITTFLATIILPTTELPIDYAFPATLLASLTYAILTLMIMTDGNIYITKNLSFILLMSLACLTLNLLSTYVGLPNISYGVLPYAKALLSCLLLITYFVVTSIISKCIL